MVARRYRVHGSLPESIRGRFEKQVRVHAFVPIDPESEEVRSFGWASVDDPRDTDLTADKFFRSERIVLALRCESLKVPKGEVKRLLFDRVRDEEARTGMPISGRQKKVLRAELERELRKRLFPRSRVTDMSWDLERGRLLHTSTSKGAEADLLELFVKTFGMEVEPDGPARWTHDLFADALVDQPDAGEKMDEVRKMLRDLQPTPELLFGFSGLRDGGQQQ